MDVSEREARRSGEEVVFLLIYLSSSITLVLVFDGECSWYVMGSSVLFYPPVFLFSMENVHGMG